MKRVIVILVIVLLSLSFANSSCKNKSSAAELLTEKSDEKGIRDEALDEDSFDSTLVASFFYKHPLLQKYETEVRHLYKEHHYHYLWYEPKGIHELRHLLYHKINTIEEEGVQVRIPYKNSLETIFQNATTIGKPNPDDELLLSSLYFFYTDKVFHGLDAKKTDALGWHLPRKKESYIPYLDSLLVNPSLFDTENKALISQYYRLKKALGDYRELEKKGGWNVIAFDPKMTAYSLGDSAITITQIRKRLFITGDLGTDSKSNIYDAELQSGIIHYEKRNGLSLETKITPRLLTDMNIPTATRIKTIMVNMERCRWIPPSLSQSKEYIVINIPSFRLTYFKDNEPALVSNVVVGKSMNQTVVFSGMMQYIVFSPYWNVPRSIIKKEIAPAMDKNKNYLAQHDMEWNGGNIRQKPGPKNSLGLVKFLFPNTNSIYLHDTPSKNLFNEEKRAFSHGCIRVAKPVALANLILKDDSKWTPEKIEAAMNSGKESWYTLKRKIPVYIGYFTAWVDHEGILHFYDDVYGRDENLAPLIFE